MEATFDKDLYLSHHGIKGQKWGVRRYQNEDGTLTEEGRRRYYTSDGKLTKAGMKLAKRELKTLETLKRRADLAAQEADVSKFDKRAKTAGKVTLAAGGTALALQVGKQLGTKHLIDLYKNKERGWQNVSDLQDLGFKALDESADARDAVSILEKSLDTADYKQKKIIDAARTRAEEARAAVNSIQNSKEKAIADAQNALYKYKQADSMFGKLKNPVTAATVGAAGITAGAASVAIYSKIRQKMAEKNIRDIKSGVAERRYQEQLAKFKNAFGNVKLSDIAKKNKAYIQHSDELEHFGILGMKWGIRRYQNPDGTLTEAGKRRYKTKEGLEKAMQEREEAKKAKHEAEKEKAVSSGDPRKIKKYVSELSNDELNRAVQKARYVSDLKKIQEQNKKPRKPIDPLKLITDAFSNSAKLGNSVVDAANAAKRFRALFDDPREAEEKALREKFESDVRNSKLKDILGASKKIYNESVGDGLSDEERMKAQTDYINRQWDLFNRGMKGGLGKGKNESASAFAKKMKTKVKDIFSRPVDAPYTVVNDQNKSSPAHGVKGMTWVRNSNNAAKYGTRVVRSSSFSSRPVYSDRNKTLFNSLQSYSKIARNGKRVADVTMKEVDNYTEELLRKQQGR